VTPRLVFRPEAEAELLGARAWYEGERVGLGAIFAAAVETTVTAILQNPLAYPRVKGDTRRALVRRFPYAVYFRPIGDEIVVLALMHGRRLPRRWPLGG
jgi:plasmid stabilization system protein ParE